MPRSNRLSQGSTLGGDGLDPDATLSSRRNSNPRPGPADRYRGDGRSTDNNRRPTAATGSRQVPGILPSQALGSTVMDRRTILPTTYVPAITLPVSLNPTRRGPEPILKPRVDQTDTKQDNRRATVYWKPPTDSSTEHD